MVVLDFGLVTDRRCLARDVSERDWFDAVAYMAPEQVTGDLFTPATDWYGVGGLLFQALTGRLPFEGTSQAILDAKLARDGPSPRDLNPDVPEALEQICTRLLRRDAEERPSGQQIVDFISSRPSVRVPGPAVAFEERR